MNVIRFAAITLIIAGALALLAGGFTYTRQTRETSMGPINQSIEDQRTFNIPLWAGVGAIVAGDALLLMGGRK